MIDGLGTDIIEIARIEAAMNRSPAFSKRLFTEAEASYCNARGRPAQHFAGRFAAKEAVIKHSGARFPGARSDPERRARQADLHPPWEGARDRRRPARAGEYLALRVLLHRGGRRHP